MRIDTHRRRINRDLTKPKDAETMSAIAELRRLLIDRDRAKVAFEEAEKNRAPNAKELKAEYDAAEDALQAAISGDVEPAPAAEDVDTRTYGTEIKRGLGGNNKRARKNPGKKPVPEPNEDEDDGAGDE